MHFGQCPLQNVEIEDKGGKVLLSPHHPVLLEALLPGRHKVQAVWPFVLGHRFDYRTMVRGPGLRVPAPLAGGGLAQDTCRKEWAKGTVMKKMTPRSRTLKSQNQMMS